MSEQNPSTTTAPAARADLAAEPRAARSLLGQHQFNEALACCRQMENLDVRNEEVPQLLAETVVAQSRDESGLQPDGRLLRRLRPRPAKAEQPLVKLSASGTTGGPPLTVIQQLEAAVRDRPSIPDSYLQLAQAYLDKDRDYDAERLLAKGREATDHDFRVQTMWEEVSMLRHARRVEVAKEELKVNDNPQTRQSLADARKDRDKAELDIFRGRVKRQGADAAAHYGLGICLQRADRPQDACQHLEKALADKDMCAPAALALGHCLRQLDDLPGAMRYYRLAVDSALWTDQLACRNEALTDASKLAAQMKLTKLAERYSSAVSKQASD
jgi:tetratricopeptide (TPR) repeat protein